MRIERLRRIAVGIVCCSVVVVAAAYAEEEYPLREKFPSVKYLTTEALHAGYQDAIIVDVRSKIEFDVIHISKAVHVPISTAMFTKDLEKVRAKDGAAKIAFYCNGHTCAKSYEAVEQATAAGFKNVYAYDAGIYDWIKAHPDKGMLMGKTPVAPDKLISSKALAKRKIGYDEFKTKAGGPNVTVIDIREPYQRQTVPQLPMLRNIPSDRLVELLKQGEFKGNKLLILDEVGKQVQWIQYYLEMYGYVDYLFLDKGVEGVK